MLMISDDIDQYHVEILCESVKGPLILKVDLTDPIQMTLEDDVFTSVKSASAVLVGKIGHAKAVELLTRHNVPRTHPIWDLNHSDLWQPHGPAQNTDTTPTL